MDTIEVLFTCDSCGVVDAKVPVPIRTTEDVVAWVEKVMAAAISRRHYELSPWCHATTMNNVKIPVTGASKIGGPCEN